MADMANQVRLDANVIASGPLRYSPAGLPILDMTLAHQSEQMEAGRMRRVELEIAAVAMGDLASVIADTPLGCAVRVEGFLLPARKGSPRIVLHLQRVQRLLATDTVMTA